MNELNDFVVRGEKHRTFQNKKYVREGEKGHLRRGTPQLFLRGGEVTRAKRERGESSVSGALHVRKFASSEVEAFP